MYKMVVDKLFFEKITNTVMFLDNLLVRMYSKPLITRIRLKRYFNSSFVYYEFCDDSAKESLFIVMDIQDKDGYFLCSFSRKFCFELWHEGKATYTERFKHTFQQLSIPLLDHEDIDLTTLEKKCSYLCKKIGEYFKKSNQSKTYFIKKYSKWLNVKEEVVVSKVVMASKKVEDFDNSPGTSTEIKRGRPKKPFSECSQRSKRRRLAEMSKLDESLVNSLSSADSGSNVPMAEVNTDEVLSLIIEAKLTKHQYILLKNFVNTKTHNVTFPSYQNILKAKKKCYPEEEKIYVTESSAEIELQSLLNHTASRIMESQKIVLDNLPVTSSQKLTLIAKWGFDGTTGQSQYKQRFEDQISDDDSSLFITSYVPLQLIMQDTETPSSNDIIIWKNPRPASTRYVRPIRFQFKKETKELTLEEDKYYREKINCLEPTVLTVCGRSFSVDHVLQLTMIDGKVCSALSELSPSRCFICGSTPSQMNNIDECLKKPVNKERYEFGLSPLHAWIRFFEYFIHVSYRLEIKKWQMRSDEDKENFHRKKKLVQDQFRQKMGLIVDKPQSGGSGSSNDGNTARTFFENPEMSAEITGLDKDLLYRCSIILKVLSSGYKINKAKFETYAINTARLLVAQYPWYNLPASVHKVLIHGSDVIEFSLLSIGELTEEAAEAKNKDVKYYRQHNTRKTSRIMCNRDLLNRLLLTSDPYITSLRDLPKKKKTILPKDAISLLM